VLTKVLWRSSVIQRDGGVYVRPGSQRRSGIFEDAGFGYLVKDLWFEVADERPDLAKLVPERRQAMKRQRSFAAALTLPSCSARQVRLRRGR
jgi:hypothetical protein